MNHEELAARIASLPNVDESFVPYTFAWVEDARPVPTLIALIPLPNGTVTATRGDLRTKAEPVRTETGELRIFPDENAACEWAWDQLRAALQPAPQYDPDQRAAAQASGDAQRARIQRILDEGAAR